MGSAAGKRGEKKKKGEVRGVAFHSSLAGFVERRKEKKGEKKKKKLLFSGVRPGREKEKEPPRALRPRRKKGGEKKVNQKLRGKKGKRKRESAEILEWRRSGEEERERREKKESVADASISCSFQGKREKGRRRSRIINRRADVIAGEKGKEGEVRRNLLPSSLQHPAEGRRGTRGRRFAGSSYVEFMEGKKKKKKKCESTFIFPPLRLQKEGRKKRHRQLTFLSLLSSHSKKGGRKKKRVGRSGFLCRLERRGKTANKYASLHCPREREKKKKKKIYHPHLGHLPGEKARGRESGWAKRTPSSAIAEEKKKRGIETSPRRFERRKRRGIEGSRH